METILFELTSTANVIVLKSFGRTLPFVLFEVMMIDGSLGVSLWLFPKPRVEREVSSGIFKRPTALRIGSPPTFCQSLWHSTYSIWGEIPLTPYVDAQVTVVSLGKSSLK